MDLTKKHEELLEQIRGIEEERNALFEKRFRKVYIWAKDTYDIREYVVCKDKYRARILQNQKNKILRELDRMDADEGGAPSPVLPPADEGRKDEALRWAAGEYVRVFKPRRLSDVKKRRKIAAEAISQFFPNLKGKERKKKIDSFRGRIVTEVRKLISPRRKTKA
jgi:hypothetical protein